jgi:oligopeptide transport system permease protein
MSGAASDPAAGPAGSVSPETTTLLPHEPGSLGQAGQPGGRSLWDDARRRLFRNRAAVASLMLLALLVIAATVGPWLSPFAYDDLHKDQIWSGPLAYGHLLGTDALGRDLLARLLLGLRVSLTVGVVATLVSLVIGIAYGATAGYLGGRIDEVMMRIVDILYSLPFIFFVILLMVTFGKNFILLFVAIGAVEWLTMARIVRGQTISLKQKDFIEAARAAGLTNGAIIRRHIAPNLLGPVVVYVTLTIPGVILAESFLSFLGLGVQEPMTSLGTLISEGARDMELAPWLLIWPGLVMALTLMAFNFLGDGLRDAIDPKDR